MNMKEITAKSLWNAGFERFDIMQWKKGNVTLKVNRGTINQRNFICYVYTIDMRFIKAFMPVDTVEQFNTFMELMDLEFRIKED